MWYVQCRCGGTPKYVESFMVDQYKCSSCGYQTMAYFDGADLAQCEWNKRNSEGDNKKTKP